LHRAPVDAIIRAAAVGALIAAAWLQAWSHYGSTLSADWLGYALLAALVLVTVLAAGAGVAPSRATLVALGALAVLAAFQTLSAAWSPLPSLARDEGFLTAFYAIVVALPLLVLRGRTERLLATCALVFGMASLAVAVAVKITGTQDASDLYTDARLSYPISYANAQAAMFLVAFWPAIALAARRALPAVVRALACGAATALLSGWILTQSKGGGLGLVVSAVAFFAVSPQRLRSVPPTLIGGGVAALGFYRLTEPYRADERDYLDAIQRSGSALLWLSAIAAAAGLVYALVDRRVRVGDRLRRMAAAVVIAAVACSLVAGAAAFVSRVDSPSQFARDRWDALKAPPGRETGTSHFTSLGSNRPDFWRVDLEQFPKHPIAGAGSRAFYVLYLQHRRSDEQPTRGHSLELDVLLENGVVGLALLLVALGTLVGLCLRYRARPSSAAAFAGGAYWLAHAAVDWNWNVPAATIPFFVLLGIGAAPGGTRRAVPRTPALAAAAVVALIGVLAFAPVWISGNSTREAFLDPARAADHLRTAKRFDPLTVDPYVMEALLDRRPAARVRALRVAARKEPDRYDVRRDLGYAYLAAGQRRSARRELRAAARLDPRNAKAYLQAAR
jgi:hypothetical protein